MRNIQTFIFLLFLSKLSYLLWFFICSHLQLLAQGLNLLIWREKKYGQYPSIMHIKLQPKTSSISQFFHLLGTILAFGIFLFQCQNTILDTLILVWFHGKLCGPDMKFCSSHCRKFYSMMEKQDIVITLTCEWRTVIHFEKCQALTYTHYTD